MGLLHSSVIVVGLQRDRIAGYSVDGGVRRRRSELAAAVVRLGGHRFIVVGGAIRCTVLHVSLSTNDRGPLDS